MNKFVVLALSCGLGAAGAYGQDAAQGQSGSAVVAQPPVKPSTFKAAYKNDTNGPQLSGPFAPAVNHYFEVGGKVGTWSIVGVGRVDSVWSPDKNQENKAGDHFLKVNTPTIEAGGTKVMSQIRAYTPGSKASQEKLQDGALEPRIVVSGKVGSRLDLQSVLCPKVVAYKAKEDGQALGSVSNIFGASYEISPKLSLDFLAVPGVSYTRGQSAAKFNDLPVYPGVTVNLTDKFAISPWMEIFAAKPKAATSTVGASVSVVVF